jgi:hypothetical protein
MAAAAEWGSCLPLGRRHDSGEISAPEKDFLMSVIFVFVLFVLIGDVAAVGISYEFERISNFVSLMVFLGLFLLVFGVAWKLAVVVTERFLVRQN